MKLSDLDPRFYRYETRIETWQVVVGNPDNWRERGCPSEPFTGPREYRIPVQTIAEAQAVIFLCPKCFEANGRSSVGVHSVEVSFADRGVTPQQATHNSKGEPVFWNASGTGLADLTLTPSIQCDTEGGCGLHIHVAGGETRNA